MCTGAVNRDSGSGFKNGKYEIVDNIVHDPNIGSPCLGDQGTSLMIMENNRFCNTIFDTKTRKPLGGFPLKNLFFTLSQPWRLGIIKIFIVYLYFGPLHWQNFSEVAGGIKWTNQHQGLFSIANFASKLCEITSISCLKYAYFKTSVGNKNLCLFF